MSRHRLLAFAFWSHTYQWSFERDGARESVAVRPTLAMNDYAGLAAALAAGGGIGELPALVARRPLADGALVEVMRPWHFPALDLSLVHLGSRLVARPVRLFKEVAVRLAPTLFPDLPA